MAKGVTYTKQSDAEEYASEVGGTVVPVDKDSDGVTDGFNVIEPQEPGKDEVITRGLRKQQPTPYVPNSSLLQKLPSSVLPIAVVDSETGRRKRGTEGVITANNIRSKRIKDKVDEAKNKNMGGMMTDELGYMRGGMTEEARGPIKYSKGGAIAGKNFKGSF